VSARRYLRLLPAVVLLGTGLLVLKGVDIARAAQAAAAVADPDAPDNSGLAPADSGGKPAPDFADAGDASASPAEVDVLSSLTRRRAELDARERALAMRENLLNAGEARVDQKIAALKALQGDIQGLLAERDAKQDAQIAALVKTYSTMKPKDAARIFNTLSDDVLLPVAKGMKSDVMAPVLAAMNPDAAQKLTVKLAALLKLPDTAPAAICPVTASAADTTAPATDATAAAPPVQTASLNPPVVTPLPTPPAPTVTPQPAAATPPAADKPAPKKPVAHKTPPPKPAAPTPPKQAAATPAPSTTTPATTPPAATPKPSAAVAAGPPAGG
jgi:flagellar motility protein MotE (MotC chaperone)